MEMNADSKRKPRQRDSILAERARRRQEEALDDALKNTASLPRCEISILYRGAGPFAADRGRHFSVTRVTGGSPSKP